MRTRTAAATRLAALIALALFALTACAAGSVTADTAAPPPTHPAAATATRTPTATATPALVETLPPTITLSPTDLPTRTPVPSPTRTPLPSATPTRDAPLAAESATPPEGVPVALVYGSNLRAGPGFVFDPFDFIEAGREVLVTGRDAAGRWLRVTAPSGAEGWIAATQLPASFDPLSVPLAEDIPQPPPTLTPSPTPSPGDPVLFELPVSGDVACSAVMVTFPAAFPVAEGGQVFAAFNPAEPPASGAPFPVYAFEGELPEAVVLYVEGAVRARDCDAAGRACTGVSFTLCASAATGARPGDVTEPALWLVLGTQSGSEFERDASVLLPLIFSVAEAS